MKILFLGDIFGEPGIQGLEKELPNLRKKHQIDFVIAQGENASGRKGLVQEDYLRLKKAGVNVFTMGNHVWAKEKIDQIIGNEDIIRPLNVFYKYKGEGSRVFKVKGKTLRVTQLMGISFNPLHSPWKETQATNFFDAFDSLPSSEDFHVVDFHGETTSEKNVFARYLDGRAAALIGTHTHVQTADQRVLDQGLVFITDVGMCGPSNSAIGASYQSVYKKMRYEEHVRFEVATTVVQINGVILDLTPGSQSIKRINYIPD